MRTRGVSHVDNAESPRKQVPPPPGTDPANRGYHILQFGKNGVLANLDGLHEVIADELRCITHPKSLIKGEGFGRVQACSLKPLLLQ
jgi:hypothetical protein